MTAVLKYTIVLRYKEGNAMISRRSLLGVLFSLGGLTVLLSACKHRPSYSEQKKPDTGTGTNGGGAGGGY